MNLLELLTVVLAISPSLKTVLDGVDRRKLSKDDLHVILQAQELKGLEQVLAMEKRSLEILELLQKRGL